MADIFISYCHHDRDVAGAIEDGMRGAGFSVWRDETRLHGGDVFGPTIQHALNAAKCVIACLSPHSTRSEWVRAEVKAGKGRIIPTIIEPFDMTVDVDALVGSLHLRDLTPWVTEGDAAAWHALLSDVGAMLNQTRFAAPPAPKPKIPKKGDAPTATGVVYVTGGSTDNVIGVVQGDVTITKKGS